MSARAVAHYYGASGSVLATKFVDDLEKALGHISRHPDAGSPRCSEELGIPGLRSWTLATFPHMVFYRVSADHLDVARVLHASRDIAGWLTTNE